MAADVSRVPLRQRSAIPIIDRHESDPGVWELHRYAYSLDVLSLPFHLPAFDVAMAWHPRSHEDPGHQWLREHFIRAADQATV